MKIHCLSDFHDRCSELPPTPPCDVLVIAGDITTAGYYERLAEFLTWTINQPAAHVVFVAGNHELGLDGGDLRKVDWFRVWCETHGVHWLCDQGAVIEGVRFYGSSWTLGSTKWAFAMQRDSLQARTARAQIPECDVLITHNPPHGVLDLCGDKHQGCKYLARRVLEIKPKLHVFGHLHQEGGKSARVGETIYVNAAALNDDYEFHQNVGVTVDIPS